MILQTLRLILLSYMSIILGAVFGLIIWAMLCLGVYIFTLLAGHFVSGIVLGQVTGPIYSATGYFWCSTLMTAMVIYRMKDKF